MSSAILLGFAAGMSFTQSFDPFFKIGAGADLLFETGPVLVTRVESNHELDLLTSLGAGWFASGLRENEGLPLGISLGAAFQRAREGETAIGARVIGAYGLYFARVMIEVDATMLRPIGYSTDTGVDLRVGVALRFVPWSPFVL